MSRPLATLAAILLPLAVAGCVQPTYDRTVVYELDVSALDSVTAVGVRGDDSPLSWQKDSLMTVVVRDSLYRTVITYKTGYLKTEVKFTVNGKWELEQADNRRVAFDMSRDTTVYRARFNQR